MMKPFRANSITVLIVLVAIMVPGNIAFVPTALSSLPRNSRTSITGSVSSTSSMVLSSSSVANLLDQDKSAVDNENSSNIGSVRSVTEKKQSLQPVPVLFQYLMKKNQSVVAGAVAAGIALFLSTALVMSPLPAATAAMSGGRMGGSFSSPSRSSYSGGGGGGGYSRSYSSGGGYSGGYRSGTSTTIIAPMPFYSPFYAPPVIYGGGVGALPVISRGGFSPFDLLFLGGFGFLFVSSFFNNNRPTGMMETSWSESLSTSSALGSGTSVLSLSVAVEVPNRDDPNSLLSVLTRLSQTSNTGDRKGVQNLTSQVALELLRRKSSIQSASSDYQHFRDVGKAEQQFNKWSVEQRSKFEQENANVFGGVDRSVKVNRLVPSNKNDNATMAVVTLVMAIQGDTTKIPKISNLKSVEEALRKIASDAKVDDCLVSAEILWTPEDRSETLTRQELIADYPELIDV